MLIAVTVLHNCGKCYITYATVFNWITFYEDLMDSKEKEYKDGYLFDIETDEIFGDCEKKILDWSKECKYDLEQIDDLDFDLPEDFPKLKTKSKF
ncbi:hypothetical protein cce_3803 [Crocosphaera subtropica ATCC 51142]|uniref:Uncharacterized protein n=2 Tax=Crocosphaera TaxID=263510 RepID=B1WNX2_CROS5|nr:hypothetical protein cce_3803 [Crocosphaera subtropica ATCC 51142]